MLKGKIHRATVTEANLDYMGSLTLDENIMDAAGLYEYEKIWNHYYKIIKIFPKLRK